MVEVFNLRTNELLGHASSQPICDSSSKVFMLQFDIFTLLPNRHSIFLSSDLQFHKKTFYPHFSTLKEHGALDFHTAFPLRCCAKGGRKVLFLRRRQIWTILLHILPARFFYHFLHQGVHGVRQRVGQGRGAEISDLLTARKPSRGQRRSSPTAETGGGATGALSRTFASPPPPLFFLVFCCFYQFYMVFTHQVLVMKETLVFIPPPQPHIETIMENVRYFSSSEQKPQF